MKKYYLATIGMVAIALGLAPVATATESNAAANSVGLDFSLASEKNDALSATDPKPTDESLANETQVVPLVVPTQAPLGSESKPDDTAKLPPPPETLTAQGTIVDSDSAPVQASLVQAPATPTINPAATLPNPQVVPPVNPQAVLQTAPYVNSQLAPAVQARLSLQEQEPRERSPRTTSPAASTPIPSGSVPDSGILSFEQSPALGRASRETAPLVSSPLVSSGLSASLQAFSELNVLFQGDTNSLVARAVGSAEGTRTPDGGKTQAYGGHVDPGNGVWNLGTFSYQHGAPSPEEADQRQLQRLRNQALELRQAAQAKGLQLTLEEELNGIDLANQSPRAALSRGGYIDRLHQAREMGLAGTEAVLWARTRSYLDPDSGRWNAPGLGNNIYSITQDQDRRLRAIAHAISAEAQSGIVSSSASTTSLATSAIGVTTRASRSSQVEANAESNVESNVEANADLILSLDLDP